MATISANGLALEYESLGNPSHPPVVLVMGLAMQLIYWPDAFCRMLVERGFHVVRFDNRDAGLSTMLDHLGTPNITLEAMKYAMHLPMKAPYYIDDMAKDTVALMDALGLGRAHVVGVSMGGMIAQNVAALFPDRVASLTSIMSTTGRRSLPSPTWRARRALLRPPAKAGDFEGAVRGLMFRLRTIGSRTYPTPEADLRDICERHVRRSYHPNGVTRQLIAIAASGDRSRVVAKIKAPTLVVHGTEDPLIPPLHGVETARVVTAGGGNATLNLVKGMGHDMPAPLLAGIAGQVASHFSN
ncbi:alpha/beta fold hydrolase [Usitatibacter palustris]|uniref:Aclacinomycin methylesterase RdmC n=1 Tax=Usitatibacter palustris TaxID=2732487 RepID=A0A6M4H447_9PROT|nr:alpha/beta hydrolase [Usitatibacter palustris]QJR14349.1 Aclacinomycin methylesterase RdmC [Usitatibacter palustris]